MHHRRGAALLLGWLAACIRAVAYALHDTAASSLAGRGGLCRHVIMML
jgi:hypothetical protein